MNEPPSPPIPPIPLLGAPTASGKSKVALELAERLPLELISGDAMQVYRGMDIGTAKPTAAERARVRHHLLDVLAPDEPFSVRQYVALAEGAIAEVLARGRLPLVVGGSGYYLRALTEGVPTVPEADPEVQAALWARLERVGLDALVAELEAAAPADAARAQRNPRRVVRALEVLERSGRPPSAFPPAPPAYRFSKVVLLPEMAVLAPRIEARAQAMFAAGLIEEVQALVQRYPGLRGGAGASGGPAATLGQPTALQAIGYKEVIAYLEGRSTRAEALAEVTRATLRYARRQRTWFRKEPRARSYEAVAEAVRDELARWLAELVAAMNTGEP